jgi:hypothetical protein
MTRYVQHTEQKITLNVYVYYINNLQAAWS